MQQKNHRVFPAAVLLAVLLIGLSAVLSACEAPAEDAADAADNSTVSLLLAADQPDTDSTWDGTYSHWKGVWNPAAGTFSYDDTAPVLTTTGPDRQYNLFSWDGDSQFVLWDVTAVTPADSASNLISCLDAVQDGSCVVWGEGYVLRLLDDRCTIQREGSAPVIVEPMSHTIQVEGRDVSYADFRFLGSALEDDQALLAYGYSYGNGHTKGVVLYATLDLATKTVDWSDPVQIPTQYSSGLFTSYRLYYPILDGKLYFSAWEAPAYWDLQTGHMVALTTLADQVASLFPAAERTINQFSSRIFPAEIEGCSDTMVIASMSFQDSEGNNHEVYQGIQADTLLGVLDFCQTANQTTLTLYNSQLQQTEQHTLPSINAPLHFETWVSPST